MEAGWDFQAFPYNRRARKRYYTLGYYVAGDFDSRLYGYKRCSDIVKIKTDLFVT